MRGIDNLSVFFLLAAAPTWQTVLDNVSSGLGCALLIILLMGAIHTVHAETGSTHSRARKS